MKQWTAKKSNNRLKWCEQLIIQDAYTYVANALRTKLVTLCKRGALKDELTRACDLNCLILSKDPTYSIVAKTTLRISSAQNKSKILYLEYAAVKILFKSYSRLNMISSSSSKFG